MKLAIHKPEKKNVATFLGITLAGIAIVYGISVALISHFSQNFKLFDTMLEIQVFALSYINVLGLVVIGLTTLLGIIVGVFYNRLMEE